MCCIVSASAGCYAGLTVNAPFIGHSPAVFLSCNRLSVSCTAVINCTGVSLNTSSLTFGGSCLSTIVPGVIYCCAVCVTAIDTLEGVGCLLTVAIALDGTGVGVGLLCDDKCSSVVLAVGCILCSIRSIIIPLKKAVPLDEELLSYYSHWAHISGQ
jgi:hypothetical protein